MTCMYSFTSYSFISFYAKEMFVDSCRKRRKVCIEEHDYFVFTSVQYIFRIKLFDSSFNQFVLFLLLSFFILLHISNVYYSKFQSSWNIFSEFLHKTTISFRLLRTLGKFTCLYRWIWLRILKSNSSSLQRNMLFVYSIISQIKSLIVKNFKFTLYYHRYII